MKFTQLTAAAMVSAVMLVTPAGVQADGTPTPSPKTIVETRQECTTGAYGQQTCKTVEYKRVLGETTPKKAEVKEAGAAENILFAALGLMTLSAAGFVYSRQQ